jgi:DNA-binding MarR family transcriptional regulator
LRRVEDAIRRISRITYSRQAAKHRADRSGVFVSQPAIAVLAAVRATGPVRLSSLAEITHLEAALVSREVRALVDDGFVRRGADPTDGRAALVELTAKGRRASEAYREATDEIVAQTFDAWSATDLKALVTHLERVVDAMARPPIPVLESHNVDNRRRSSPEAV